MITLGVYLLGGFLTALTPDTRPGWVIYLDVTRFIAGMGIGGEYAAINSAIDELIPAKYRGRVDIAVNGTYWAGAFIGAVAHPARRQPPARPPRLAGRVPDRPGARLRHPLRPEEPARRARAGCSCTAGQEAAEGAVARSSRCRGDDGGTCRPVDEPRRSRSRPTDQHRLPRPGRTLFRDYPSRSILGATLMITQSFLYNAIFFTYALVLSKSTRSRPRTPPTTSWSSPWATCSGR